MKKSAFQTWFLAVVAAGAWTVFAGPEQDFDAAVKAGRPLSAEAAYLKLAKAGPKVAPIRHYQAAKVADALGKPTQRNDRLMLFLRLEKGWGDQVAEACWTLAFNGGGIEYYERLAANVKPTEVLWTLGLSLLDQMNGANRPAEVIRLADVLMAKYPDFDHCKHVLYRLYQSSQKAGEYPEAALKAVLMKHPGLGADEWFYNFLYGSRQKAFQPDFFLRYAAKHGGEIADSVLSAQVGSIDYWNVSKLTNRADIAVRDDVAKSVRAVRKVCLDGEHPASALKYFRVAAQQLPTLFFDGVKSNDNGVVTGACALYKEVLAKHQKRYREDPWFRTQLHQARNDAMSRGRFAPAEVAALVDASPDAFDISVILSQSSLGNVVVAANKEKSVAPIERLAKKFPSRADEIRRSCLYNYASEKDGAGDLPTVKRAFLDIASRDRDFWYGALDAVIGRCTAMSVADKVALLKQGYALTGWGNPWKELKKRAKAAKGKKDAFFSDPAVQAFAESLKETDLPNEPILRTLALVGRAKTAAEGHAAAVEFAKVYPSKYGEAKTQRENDFAYSFVNAYMNLVNNVGKPEDCRKFVEFVLPKMTAKGPDPNWIEPRVRKVDDPKLWFAYLAKLSEIKGNHDPLARIAAPKGADKPYDGIDMKKMSPAAAAGYLGEFYGQLKAPAGEKLLLDYLAVQSITGKDSTTAYYTLDKIGRRAVVDGKTNLNFLSKLPLDKMAADVFATPYAPYALENAIQIVAIAHRLGKADEAVKRFCAWADKREPRDRYLAYVRLAATSNLMPPDETHKDSYWQSLLDAKAFAALLKEKLLPALQAVPVAEAATLDFNSNDLVNRLVNFRKACLAEQTKDEAGAKLVEDYFLAAVRLMTAGARNGEGFECEGPVWHLALKKALAASDAASVARLARRTGRSASSYVVGDDAAREAMAALQEKDLKEPLYLYVDAFGAGRQAAGILAESVKLRASLASSLPGVYPVGESDPSYPLYVAADELAKKNPERAWQILQQAKNQTVFEREALKLPPDFVIWGVEQLRMARGDKDALLVKARQIATAILAQESKVAPEVAAAMILSRAEGYRDQQNFEAAKLEYQSVRDNPAYHATKYGKKAMFRAMDLQISTGNTQGVEATLEYWLSQNDREIQAEAHYFLARMAYDRKDYDECSKQLRQVFAINYTHTEGRFLHGQWKLATNSEVDDTDVLVGDLAERNMIRPGNQLTVTVQDSNLSVAGGGASIPVIVTSSPSGDAERINLYPTSRDPSNFKGLVEVVLGKANPSNRVLEVRGDDTVSYVIDPAFLKERGLPLNVPKVLRVIDDAKIAIGAGAPRTDEKKTEKGVKDLLDEDAKLEDSGVVSRLRPGNPLYVVVKDADCSLGGTSDVVRVTVETSSGDRLEGYELVEEKPFAGVFRGKIETSLPPPRAFASDTAAGMNPGDVINANKKGGWKSLSDGQPGKWFEVDTMGSYLFSEILLETPSAADIKSIKLVGRMGSKVMTLGQLPAAPDASKLYLRRQQQTNPRPPRSLAQQRAYCQTSKAAKAVVADKVEFGVLQQNDRFEWQTAYYSGPFAVPAGVDALRLRLLPKSAKKDALRNLWVALAVDGEEVFSGQGCKLQQALVAADITAGCHQFELAVVAANREDNFDLLWEPAGQDPSPIPAEWFSDEKNPALKAFVKDLATIERADGGFKAVFENPVRLRSFRWEFADVKSPEVAVSRISAKDSAGETVLPVASDFSDSQNNQTLEVAPGDRITVKYEDERTTSGEKKVIQRDMASSFNDAKVRFVFEEPTEEGNVVAYDAFRFQPGDSLVLAVHDPDCDVSDEADKLSVSIRNSDGKTFTKTLAEYQPKWGYAGKVEDSYGMHSGMFMGVLRTCPAADTNAPAKVLRVKSDDLLTVSYEDRENTDPGVPCTRTVKIFAARPTEPELTLFNIRKVQEVDKSADAKVRLARIRRRPGNENVQVVYRDVLTAEPMSREASETTNAIPVNVSAGVIPIRVNDRSRARYAGSKVLVRAVAHSEIAKAAAEGREPERVTVPLTLGGSLSPLRLTKGEESVKKAQAAGTFNGLIHLSLGPVDPNIEVPVNAPPVLCVTGSDLVDVAVLAEDGKPVITRTLKLVSDANLGLTDSTFEAERNSAHVGESFFVMVDDADRDATEDPDRIEAEVVSSKTGVKRPLVLSETMPHSGVFTGRLRPVMFAPGEAIPSVATGGVVSAEEALKEDRFAVGYGDQVIFRYRDDVTLPGTPARTLSVTGTVFRGANGDVRMFSKRFTDRDTAVLVQFRLAECLFEQAKEHRKLKQPEKSAQAIADGKFILEEALKNYPDSSHVVQGEFLLANLYQELATEQKDAGEKEKAIPLYQEALSRFSQILGTWPEGDYAARSQFHKAFCLEMLEDFDRASEEYVKMTYLYPESELVGEATIRLATHYFTHEKRFDIAGHIYRNFQHRFPQHEKAPRTLFMAGSCYIKQAETVAEDVEKRKEAKQPLPQGYQAKVDECYRDAVRTFDSLVETYREGDPKLRAQALYWAGDVCVRRHDYTKAYQYLKRTVFEFPETEWARRARGLLLQEGKNFESME